MYYQAESDYFATKTRLFRLEALLLQELSFNVQVVLPHPLAITYLQTMDFFNQDKTEVSRKTIQYLNTALLSPQMLYLTHHPYALAAAALYVAAKDLGAKMPECEWWEIFDIDREELGFLVVAMKSLDGIVKKRKEESPNLWNGMLRRKHIENELKSRGVRVENGTAAVVRDEEDEVMDMMDQR